MLKNSTKRACWKTWSHLNGDSSSVKNLTKCLQYEAIHNTNGTRDQNLYTHYTHLGSGYKHSIKSYASAWSEDQLLIDQSRPRKPTTRRGLSLCNIVSLSIYIYRDPAKLLGHHDNHLYIYIERELLVILQIAAT